MSFMTLKLSRKKLTKSNEFMRPRACCSYVRASLTFTLLWIERESSTQWSIKHSYQSISYRSGISSLGENCRNRIIIKNKLAGWLRAKRVPNTDPLIYFKSLDYISNLPPLKAWSLIELLHFLMAFLSLMNLILIGRSNYAFEEAHCCEIKKKSISNCKMEQ